ncbi:MAG: zeta toxin family protein [Haliea sp.]|nr:zeta toxin family protein [Haliea sp.]MDP5064913.1 zeta toxin family protein [Haliea sp.]
MVFAKAQKKVIAKRIADKAKYPPEEKPVSVFMAGSPGAGKTEASKALLASFENEVLRIDPDDLRAEFSDYDGANSWLFQPAVSIVVEKIHDLALAQRQSFILDGTLTNTPKAADNISRSLKKGRYVQILYVYQDPIVAWDFVQAREKVEGRKILLEHFIEQYFAARDSVNTLKRDFGKKVAVDLLLQNSDNSQKMYKANIDQIDNHVSEKYTRTALESQLRRI